MNWIKEIIEAFYPKPSEKTKDDLAVLDKKVTELNEFIRGLGEDELLAQARSKLYKVSGLVEHYLRSKGNKC